MKAIPMKGRLTGKRVSGYLWAGRGRSWRKKENYFQLEDPQLFPQFLLVLQDHFGLGARAGHVRLSYTVKGIKFLLQRVLALPGSRK